MPRVLRATLVVVLLSVVASAQIDLSGTVSGTVLDETGAVIANAHIFINVGGLVGAARTDSFGQFRVKDLQSGIGKLSVKASGFEEQQIDVRVAQKGSPPITVRMKVLDPGVIEEPVPYPNFVDQITAPIGGQLAEIRSLPLFSERSRMSIGIVSGKVERRGKPVKNVKVRIKGSSIDLSTHTNNAGEFSFAGLFPAEYDLELKARGSKTQRAKVGFSGFGARYYFYLDQR
jgi:hypothetical protein